MGLGLSGGAWWRTVPVLARRLRVITFDHRGVGRSRAFSDVYTTEAMADDAACVLDAAGVGRAHVYGISLGGMVAQQLALRHPERVRSLVLGATARAGRAPPHPTTRCSRSSAGGCACAPTRGRGRRCRSTTARGADATTRSASRRTSRSGSQPVQRPRVPRPALCGGTAQLLGRLPRIAVPTLVVHGRHDRMVPVENGRILAERIPGARLEILDESGHLYPTEEPAVDEAIAEFLAARDEEDAA